MGIDRLVPIIGSLWYLFWNGLQPGTPGPNRFGPDPLGGSPAAVFGDDPMIAARRKPPIVSTIVAWALLAAIFSVTVLLFQNPNAPANHQPTKGALPPK